MTTQQDEVKILNKLYKGECKASIQLVYHGNKLTFALDLLDRDRKPDCCINHFGYNVFIRTNKGLTGEKYKTLGTLKRACSDKLKEYNIIPVFLVIEGQDIRERIPFN